MESLNLILYMYIKLLKIHMFLIKLQNVHDLNKDVIQNSFYTYIVYLMYTVSVLVSRVIQNSPHGIHFRGHSGGSQIFMFNSLKSQF